MGFDWKAVETFSELSAILQSDSLRNCSLEFLRNATLAAPLTGGLTNRQYCCKVEKEGKATELWVVRISGENVEVHFIDRAREYQCLQAAYNIGITSEPHFHPGLKLLVQRLVEDADTFDNDKAAAHIPQCIELMKKLHGAPANAYPPFAFDVFAVIDHYLAVCKACPGTPLPPKIDSYCYMAAKVKHAMDQGGLASLPKVCCHNDVLAANWLTGHVQGGPAQLWLIDFEYAAVGDRFFDVANFVVNCELDAAGEQATLDAYFGGGAWGPEHRARMKLYKIVSDLREGLWSYVQWGVSTTCPQAFYQEYGEKCIQRFVENTSTPEFDRWMKEVKGTAS